MNTRFVHPDSLDEEGLRFCESCEARLTEEFEDWLDQSKITPQSTCSDDPFFSIIVPLYNRADQIERCLKSIQLQEFTDFEIIVIDDASTDRSAEVVERIACQDARIRLIRLENNIGCARVRNLGVAQARGKYIRICDSDDFYPPDALSVFADRLAGEEVDLIAGNLIYWLSRPRKARHYPGPATVKRDVRSADLMELPELWEQIYFHRCAFRRQFLIENRIESPDLRRGADPVFMAEVNAKARSFMLIKDPVYLFHIRPRNRESSFEIMRSSLESHTQVHDRMLAAGYAEIAFFFTCFHSPFPTSYDGLTEAESLQLATGLVELAKRIPPETLDHPFLKHPSFDHTRMAHDLLVVRNSSPEMVVKLVARGVFGNQDVFRTREIARLNLKIKNLNRQLRPFLFPLRVYRGLKRRIGLKSSQNTPRRKNPAQRVAPRAFSPVQQKIDAVHDRLPPRFLLFDINQLCNLRCTHCDVWKNRPEEVVDARSYERIRETIAEFAQLSPHGSVVTCGGEPMYDPEHWFWLCRTVHEHGLPFLSVVNGTFIQTPDMAERAILEGADEITISLDHYIPEIHDRMRGVPGAFEKAIRALRLLLEARDRHPEHHKPIMVMGLIGKTTYQHLEAFHDFVLNELGADKLKLNMIQPSFSTDLKQDHFFEEEGDVNPRRLRKILDRCDRRFSLGMNPVWKDTVVMYFRSISRCKDRAKGWHSGARTDECICNAVDRDIVLDIYGTARYCFSRNFLNFPIQKPGDLKTFWEHRGEWRDQMNSCNLCCGISHSLRAESGTLAGVRKAEQFIEKNLGPNALDPRKQKPRHAKPFSAWLHESEVVPPPACNDEPLFSIIIPAYNRVTDIAGCLKSIQLQDVTDFEVIVVDDASNDATPDVVTRLAQRDPRIQLIRLEENIGPGPARNIGIQQARGKYIRICDSDDFYPQGALAAFARRIAESADDLIAGNLNCWHSRTQQIRPFPGPWQIHRRIQTDDLRQLPELWAMVHFHRCAFRREFLLENQIEYPAMRRGEDPVYMAEVLSKARSFALIPEAVYLFHERSRNQQFPYEHIRDAVAAHGRIRQIMSDAGYLELGFFFDCYYPPFTLSHDALTDEESLQISAQLIDFANHFPVEMLENPYLDHPACDKVALHHDLLVAQNQSPEQVAEWMRRRMFCGQEHLRQNEIEKLRQTVRALNRQLKPFRPFLRIYRGLKRRIVRRAVV